MKMHNHKTIREAIKMKPFSTLNMKTAFLLQVQPSHGLKRSFIEC